MGFIKAFNDWIEYDYKHFDGIITGFFGGFVICFTGAIIADTYNYYFPKRIHK